MEEQDHLSLSSSGIVPFTSVTRTLNYVVLINDKSLQFLNLATMKKANEFTGYQNYQLSITDDSVFFTTGKENKVVNIATNEEYKVEA
jgi:hypothetical protein